MKATSSLDFRAKEMAIAPLFLQLLQISPAVKKGNLSLLITILWGSITQSYQTSLFHSMFSPLLDLGLGLDSGVEQKLEIEIT